MEDAYFRTMLFDCYGELLTEKQREYFDLHYNEDLSLAEIAESEGISRQGVWDTIRRGEETMRRYEQKTGLVARFAAQRGLIGRAEAALLPLSGSGDARVRAAAEEIAQILRELRHGI